MSEILGNFSLGQQVSVIRDDEPIGTATVTEIERSHHIPTKLVIKDLELFPARQMSFGYISEAGGWKLLLEDPTTKKLTPGRTGAIYQFKSPED